MKCASYIDPMIGTVGDEQDTSFHGGGKTHPGACTPGGMVQLSPDTVTGGDNGTGYNYCQTTIEGFSFNHMSGVGWYGDLGNLQIMPVVGDVDLRSGSNHEIPFEKGSVGWRSGFSHERERAEAGYYSVMLDRYGIFAEATASAHTGMLRFAYPKNADARLIFNFSRRIAGRADFQQVRIVDDRTIEGAIRCTPAGGGFGRGRGGIAYTLYFACKLSVAPEQFRFFARETLLPTELTVCENEDLGLLAYFGNTIREPLTLQCGISYVDIAGARKNLQAEDAKLDFDAMRQQTFAQWEEALSAVRVEGSDETAKTLFYTCLYHALLDPRTAEDTDGRYAICGQIFPKDHYTQRTMFSGWDVYRSEFPLLTLLRPDVVSDTVNSLMTIAKRNGSALPRWELMGIDSGCMVGDPGLIVAADAYMKGIRDFDEESLYQIGIASCKGTGSIRTNHPVTHQYMENAYDKGSVSDTLEFLLADYTMYRMAQAMGKDQDAEYFLSRVKRYPENYDASFGFMSPRDAEGNFLPVKDEYDKTGCVESNLYQQSWYVPYDIPGLRELFGRERCVQLLERLFEKADLTAMWNENYNHSNEPCHNLTHYFNMLGLPYRCQYWTRRVQTEAYRLGAFGFCGNEDVGQLSAWYVLSALGFAQICPGHNGFFVNTPLFATAQLRLNRQYHSCSVSDVLEIRCDADPQAYPYICAMELNGKKLNRPYLTYGEITAGGTLCFQLAKEPCLEFGREIPENFY